MGEVFLKTQTQLLENAVYFRILKFLAALYPSRHLLLISTDNTKYFWNVKLYTYLYESLCNRSTEHINLRLFRTFAMKTIIFIIFIAYLSFMCIISIKRRYEISFHISEEKNPQIGRQPPLIDRSVLADINFFRDQTWLWIIFYTFEKFHLFINCTFS